MTPARYAILGVVALLLALVLNAPAATLYAWLRDAEKPAPVQLYGLEGTLRQGRLSGLSWNGQVLLADLQWRFRPWLVLLGRLDFKVDGGGEAGLIDGRIGVGPGGRVSLRDAKFSSPIKPLLAAAGYPLPWIDGRAELDAALLKLRHGLPTDAEGRVVLHGLTWGMGQAAALGDVAADVTREGDAIVAKLSSLSGPLEIAGEARLGDDGAYELKVQYKPRADAPPAVQNLVRQGGAPDTQGFYHLDRRGTLKPAAAES